MSVRSCRVEALTGADCPFLEVSVALTPLLWCSEESVASVFP